MAAYLIYAITEVTDQAKSAEYLANLPPVLEKFGGKGEVVRKEARSLSGKWQPKLVTIFRFDSIERIEEWFNSEEYAPLNKLRQESRIDDMVAIDIG